MGQRLNTALDSQCSYSLPQPPAVAGAPWPGPEHARDTRSGASVQLEGIPLCIVSKCMHMYIYVCVCTCIYAYIHIYTKVYQAKAVT